MVYESNPYLVVHVLHTDKLTNPAPTARALRGLAPVPLGDSLLCT